MRTDGREANTLRAVKIERHVTKHANGSVLITAGDTKVLCTAMVEEKVPRFMKGENRGWLTAEYSMLPSSCITRKMRERNRVDGRSQEIQRLIGRALRSVLKLEDLGERTIWIDCDVLQADGGTRTAAITGAFVALVDTLYALKKEGKIESIPLRSGLSAISVGVVDDEALLDLCYEEDSKAHVDMNVIMSSKGEIIEIQGTGEKAPFKKEQLLTLLELAENGNKQLRDIQKEALKEFEDMDFFENEEGSGNA